MKNFIIVILILAVLGLGGFIIYDKVIDKDNYQKQIKELKEELNKVRQKNTNSLTTPEEKTNSIVGYYKTGKLSTPRVTCESGSLEQTTEIHLLENGTFTYQYQSSCDSAEQTGTYTYNGNKLVLTCDANNSEQCDGTPTEYIVNENGSLNLSDGRNLVYDKIEKNDLQVLTK